MSAKPKKTASQSLVSGLASRGSVSGYELPANILVGVFLGWVIQRYWPAAKPLGIFVGTLLGTVSGIWQIYKKSIIVKKAPKPAPPSEQA